MSSQNLFKRKLGTFSIPHEWIEDVPELVQEILSTVIVVKAEYGWVSGHIEYTGISHSFAPIEQGKVTPSYRIIISEDHLVRPEFICWEKNNDVVA